MVNSFAHTLFVYKERFLKSFLKQFQALISCIFNKINKFPQTARYGPRVTDPYSIYIK